MRYAGLFLIVIGFALIVKGLWIPAKALVATGLLDRAYKIGVRAGSPQSPWPWADFKVIGRLLIEDNTVHVIDRATDQALAFGAGRHEEQSGLVFSGHRDTHFSVLEHVGTGSSIVYQSLTSDTPFSLRSKRVVDIDQDQIQPPGKNEIMLLTCWPFNQLSPDTSQRLVLTGIPI